MMAFKWSNKFKLLLLVEILEYRIVVLKEAWVSSKGIQQLGFFVVQNSNVMQAYEISL